MNYHEYWKEVKSIADSIQEACESGEIEMTHGDEVYNYLQETLDGHRWTIYNANHPPLLSHTDNAEYAFDNFGCDFVSGEGCLTNVMATCAFWALHADVQERMHTMEFDFEDAETWNPEEDCADCVGDTVFANCEEPEPITDREGHLKSQTEKGLY